MDNFIKLLEEKNHTFVNLKYPYKKFKYKIANISLRSILFMNVKNKIIPIFIAKKTNKKLGYNIILDSNFEELLEKKLVSINYDIKNGDFISY